jgi:penicillin-binding protein activator
MIMVLLLAGLIALGGCSSGKKVSRIETDTVTDLSGNWNDTDSRLVAEELIAQSLTGGWISDHLVAKSKKPVVIVGQIANKSTEHIPVKVFVADLERAFINSGSVKMVASAEEREGVRDERADQQQYSSQETMKEWGREKGADYMLLGEINTINDRAEGDEAKFYQVDVYLVDLEDNTKVWAGYKKLKKYISRSGYRP